MTSVHIALAVNGHLYVNMVDRDRVRERSLCRSQIDREIAKVSQTNDREDRLAEIPGGNKSTNANFSKFRFFYIFNT